MALIPIFKIQKYCDARIINKKKIGIIMICVRTQMFTNNHRLLWFFFAVRTYMAIWPMLDYVRYLKDVLLCSQSHGQNVPQNYI